MARLAYAVITLGHSTLWGVSTGWLIYFYLPPGETPLVPLTWFSIAFLVSKIFNILFGLLVGYVSDHTSSSWGRRLPYIIGGGIFMPAFFILIWTPPHGAEAASTLFYFFVVLIGFNVAFEFHHIPYEALLPELAVGEKDRVTISSMKLGFLLGGNILAGFAGPMIEALGYVRSMWIFAVVVAPFMILPGIFLRKYINFNYQPQKQIPFLTSLKITFSNRNFQVFAVSWALFWTGATFVLEAMPFIVTEVCRLTESDAVYFYFPAIVITLIGFPFTIQLSERYGMKAIYRASLLAGGITLPSLMLIGDWIPIPLLAQGILWVVLQSASLTGAQILPSAMIAELTDHDEHITGQRREGSFYSVMGMLNQTSSGIATAVIPLFFLLGRSQLEAQGPLGVRLLGLTSGIMLLISFWVFRTYQLGNKKG